MNTWMTTRRGLGIGLGLLAALLISACGGGGGGADPVSGQGTLRVALTDAPSCGYDEVNVTVERIRVHQSSTAEDDEGGWQELVLSPGRRVNLLDLTNGVLEELGSTPLPAGRYTQLRLVLADNGGADPLANSVLPTGGSETPLQTPSAQQSGLKLPVDIEVGADEVADVVLDFDACRSVVRAGNSGRYLLKPVLRVLPRVAVDGLVVEGHVAPALAAGLPAAATVSLQQDSVVVRATVPDAGGRFVLSPVPAGSYDLVIAAAGRATLVVTGVPVLEVGRTFVASAAAPLDPPVSAMGRAFGSAETSGSSAIPDALVRALQAAGATVVEVIARNVDADTGGYDLALPLAAPQVAVYASGALSFAADDDAAGLYTLEAAVAEQPLQSADIDLGEGDAETLFTFAP